MRHIVCCAPRATCMRPNRRASRKRVRRRISCAMPMTSSPSLAPSNDEEEWLAERRSLMMQAEKIVADLRDAQEAIAGENSAVAGLARRDAPSRAPARAGAHPHRSRRESDRRDARCARWRASRARDGLARNSLRAGRARARRGAAIALRAAARKHGTSVDQLPALAEKFAADLASIEAGEARLSELKAAADRRAKRIMRLAPLCPKRALLLPRASTRLLPRNCRH